MFRQFLRTSHHFGMTIPEQPGLQLALDDLPLIDAQLVALVAPPFRNAFVTNRSVATEKRGWLGASKKFLAPGTGLYS